MTSRENNKKHSRVDEDRISLLKEQFDQEFPTEEDCVEEVFKHLFPDGKLICRSCSTYTSGRKYGCRFARCPSCRKKIWFTAGTFFHSAKKIRLRFAIAWMLDHSAVLNSFSLHKLFDVSISTAWCGLQEVSTVLFRNIHESATSVHSSRFLSIFSRRSRETPAGMHPITEQERFETQLQEESRTILIADKNSIDHKELSSTQSENCLSNAEENPKRDRTKPSLETQICDLLSVEFRTFDQLVFETKAGIPELSEALLMLELGRKVERNIGGVYKLIKVSSKKETVSIDLLVAPIAKMTQFIENTYQGISRKYLQNYLALACFHNTHSGRNRVGSLLHLCIRSEKITYQEILRSICPEFVMLIAD